MHASFREISLQCELLTSRLQVKYPLLTAQGVSRAKFPKNVKSFGMIKNARKIVTNRGRKRNLHSPNNPFSPWLVIKHSIVIHTGLEKSQLRGNCAIK